jgi:hypothetical protein
MNIRNVRNFSALALVLVASNSHANLITNGGFEDGLTSWTCTNVFVKCETVTSEDAFEGESYFFGLADQSESFITQEFATDIGTTYSISFVYGASFTNTALKLAVGDLRAEFYPSPFFGTWGTYAADFVATSSFSTVEFGFQSGLGSGALYIDAVVVELASTPVPAPATLALFGLGLAALSYSRRDRN